ncbi:hypothetical protein [Phaeospirillum tilakii]|uniref:HEPN AbiU2-like domain-containing protein n=1 Tax=Phaeospirillum tilakii TaxID=741673 RepID=A0ABW5CFL9_9PROT
MLDEFPELVGNGVDLQKEVLSHFGLLFSGYALLEAAIQNFYIFYEQRRAVMAGELKNLQDWQSNHDKLERKAFSATLGGLITLVSKCPEISPGIGELKDLKKSRNYFAHHFFRAENDKLFSEAASLHLIFGMNELRHRVKMAENFVEVASIDIIKEMYAGQNFEEMVADCMKEIESVAVRSPCMDFGWISEE